MFQITLRAARVNRGLSLQAAAKLLGKCDKTLTRYERDSSRMPRYLIEKVEIIYGIPSEFIFFGKESVFTGREREQTA